MPEAVLQQAAAEMLDWHGSGMSVMEMSHRGKHFVQICDEAEADLRELLGLPADYAVMFMQGGGLGENAIVPMNLMGRRSTPAADFVVTGHWSTRSHKEAGRYGDAQIAASAAEATEIDGQAQSSWTWLPPGRYLARAQGFGLSAPVQQRNHRRRRVHRMARSGQPGRARRAAGGRRVLAFPVASAGHRARGAGVRRRPEERRPGRRDRGHRAPRPAGPCAADLPSAFDYANVAADHSRYNTPPLSPST
ncbi:aminotransferase class V-fold PLP-dependent enzyme [Bordetella pertussis]|uniref:aminotransferase class V-fold PLP-dependent enzyme n=1 Tax=Bordetella pertussis TaxID=520 RepID=UPI003AAAD28A